LKQYEEGLLAFNKAIKKTDDFFILYVLLGAASSRELPEAIVL